jgi:hypothetical protein
MLELGMPNAGGRHATVSFDVTLIQNAASLGYNAASLARNGVIIAQRGGKTLELGVILCYNDAILNQCKGG